jgi:hypothetical protein
MKNTFRPAKIIALLAAILLVFFAFLFFPLEST